MAGEGGYQEQIKPGKDKVTGDQIAKGAIDLSHFSPALFTEFRKITLHKHTGVGSTRVSLADVEGAFPAGGFYMYGTNKTKYLVRIVAGAFDITAL